MSDTTATSVTDSPNETGTPSSNVVTDAIERLQRNESRVFSTVVGDDFDTKRTVLNAVTNAEPLDPKHLGETINLLNVVVQAVELTDPKSGEVTTQPRVILLDDKGNAYYGISPVLLKALDTFMSILGQPHTWPGPQGVVITKERSNNGFNFFNMKLAPAANNK